jgi:hypothetical protein
MYSISEIAEASVGLMSGLTTNTIKYAGDSVVLAAETGMKLTEQAIDMTLRQAWRPTLFHKAIVDSRMPPLEAVCGECYEVPGVVQAQVKDFSVKQFDPDPIPTLILPPRAFHGPEICNAFFDPAGGQSQIEWAREAGIRNLYASWWNDVALEHTDKSLTDLKGSIGKMMDFIRHKDYGGRDVKFNVIAECALGYPLIGYMLESLSKGKDEFRSVLVAGAPLDPQAGNSKIKQWVDINKMFNPFVYDMMCNGVAQGQMGLFGFKFMNWADRYYGDFVKLWNQTYDSEIQPGQMPPALEGSVNFMRWYETTMNIERNAFRDGIIPYFGKSPIKDGCQMMDRHCYPLSLIGPPIEMMEFGGAGDDITDCVDQFAFSTFYDYPKPPTGYQVQDGKYVPTPLDDFTKMVKGGALSERVVQAIMGGGHIGLFMSRGARGFYNVVFDHWKGRNDRLRGNSVVEMAPYGGEHLTAVYSGIDR